jgi:hypothetical protein
MSQVKFQEMNRLKEYTKQREDGLECSEKMLEEDTKTFLEFFNGIKVETLKATKKHDETKRIKLDKTTELRKINEEI